MPRFFCSAELVPGHMLDLPASAARHVQVLRLQPGDSITLFNHGPGWGGTSPGGEFDATVTRMGRSDVQVQVGAHHAVEREAPRPVHLAVGMPANDRMDWLVEKATELGVASIQPLMTERSVLRLSGERAEKKVAHWQSVAIAACEQCGGNRVPLVHSMQTLAQWLKASRVTEQNSNPSANLDSAPTCTAAPLVPQKFLLSLRDGALPVQAMASNPGDGSSNAEVWFLSGPEGGLSTAEEDAALQTGFAPATLGTRVLRAETAALAALITLTLPGTP
jgi:16S rRNA (uracil1498-N3)-methyltransferase